VSVCKSDVESLPTVLPSLLPRLWSFSLRLTGDRHDAEDLFQRVCVRALERQHQLQPGTAPLSWMFAIMQSLWITELRARNVRWRHSAPWDEEVLNHYDSHEPSPEDLLMGREIVAAVDRLPEGQKVVLLLVSVEGLSYAEVANVLNVPMGTVMSRLSRARQSVATLLGSGAPVREKPPEPVKGAKNRREASRARTRLNA
jgi:RNA polymerase sigma-70 factor, ECF subfamily